MWCCSSSAKFLLDSILGGGGEAPSSPSEGSSSASSSTRGISIDGSYLGNEVVVVKNGLRVCGKGGALGSAPLVQTKSYFEVKVQQEGVWCVGVATRDCSLDQGLLGGDQNSWALRNTGDLFFNNMQVGKIDKTVEEGDIIGVTFDHIELCFYLNGAKVPVSFTNVRGTVYPALYVEEGAVLDIIFDRFGYTAPSGFDKIMKEKSIL